MAGAASDRVEDTLAIPRRLVDRPSGNRREELHEAGKIIDSAPAGARIADVLWLRMRVADSHTLVRDADRDLVREQVVGDAHLVAIGVGAEREQRGMLRLPAEASHPALA